MRVKKSHTCELVGLIYRGRIFFFSNVIFSLHSSRNQEIIIKLLYNRTQLYKEYDV